MDGERMKKNKEKNKEKEQEWMVNEWKNSYEGKRKRMKNKNAWWTNEKDYGKKKERTRTRMNGM